jgi:hypothetical protein
VLNVETAASGGRPASTRRSVWGDGNRGQW